MKIWLNGVIKNQDDACIATTDRGFLLGDGLFETMRAHKGKVAWLSQHLDRLQDHADAIGLDHCLLPTPEQVRQAIETLCAEIDGDDAVIRLTVTRGSGRRGILPPDTCHPTILITAAPFARPITDNGLILATSKVIRRNPWSVAGRVKSLNYLDNIAARREVASYGADEALILSVDGTVAETTIANLFAVRNGAVYTPPVECGILPGLARQCVIDWCHQNDIVMHVASIDPADLTSMDAMFVCNALQGLRLVQSIDGYSFKPGLKTTKILRRLDGVLDRELSLGIDI